ncbi:hypothetical protein [uncultured Clostridium sp.]|uniref:hypothetical protein n=1 Tax=uncultured Clostridium sp. TaxID=59620 RepID=UPI00261CE1FA|nr:hypothetical protein [uncultured Clostridium sp.]
MAKWCSLYGCWCNDVEEIIPTEQLIKDGCDPDPRRNCGDCSYIEEVNPRELFD